MPTGRSQNFCRSVLTTAATPRPRAPAGWRGRDGDDMADQQVGRSSSSDPMRLDLFWPLSGNVTQDILPWTWWMRLVNQWSLVSINLGRTPDPEMERRITGEVASYGRQL